MADNELLEKVITTTSLGDESNGRGILGPDQGNRFLDYMFDATVLGRECRVERLRGDTAELDRIHLGERLVRVATEAVDDHVNVNVTFSKISITLTKLRLDWELSTESLEDNIEGAALEDHIARMMATQIGNDLEDLAINGDAASPDPLLKAFDGWRKLAVSGGNVVDAQGRTLDKEVFNAMLKAMPRRYKQRRNQMRFYTGSNLIQDYAWDLVNSGPDAVASGLITGRPGNAAMPNDTTVMYAFGIPLVEVPMFSEIYTGTYVDADPAANHGFVELTFPQNRIWGVKREIQVFREFKPKKDTIEYTVYTRVGVAVENLEAFVVARNVAVRGGYAQS